MTDSQSFADPNLGPEVKCKRCGKRNDSHPFRHPFEPVLPDASQDAKPLGLTTQGEWLCSKCRTVWPFARLGPGVNVVFCPACETATCAPMGSVLLRETEGKLDVLRAAVERYLERPGCNINSKRTAMQRLRWALEESKQ